MQLADGPVQQGPHNRLGRSIPGQFVQITLDGGGGLSLVHGVSTWYSATED
jgi:hypothetical protein